MVRQGNNKTNITKELRDIMQTPTIEQLYCLNGWPEGTVGWHKDNEIINILLHLMTDHGFGRVPQIAAAIEDIWRNDEAIPKYQKLRDEQLANIRAAVAQRK